MPTNLDHTTCGFAAMEFGTPDYYTNDVMTNAVDTIANILHAMDDPDLVGHVLDLARMHYTAERYGNED